MAGGGDHQDWSFQTGGEAERASLHEDERIRVGNYGRYSGYKASLNLGAFCRSIFDFTIIGLDDLKP